MHCDVQCTPPFLYKEFGVLLWTRASSAKWSLEPRWVCPLWPLLWRPLELRISLVIEWDALNEFPSNVEEALTLEFIIIRGFSSL